ncbi:MAG: ANL family adenylate-forming protein [Opitutales bacterium]
MHWIKNRFQEFGPKTACIESGRSWSYFDLLEEIDAAQTALGAKRVLPIETSSTAEALAQLLAIAETDHIALPLPPTLPATERAGRQAVAAESPLYDQLAGSGLVLFSSGTSGRPKGMLHRLPALLARFQSVAPRDDRILQLLPIDHIGGLDAALRCLCAGSTLILPEARTPAAAGKAIQTHRISILPASPTFLNLMLLENVPSRFDCRSLEVIGYGAEPMPEPLLQRLQARFPGTRLQQKFGTSETGAIRIRSEGDDSLFFRIIDPDTNWKIIDGELWLKTPSRIIGYLNAGDHALEADGWYRTGDLVEETGDALRIIGRRSELINVGGQKVHPAEVEALLLDLEGIESCRVFGEPDPITGQHVACEIFSRNGRDTRAWKRAIRQHGRGKIAPWKLPSRITLAPELKLSGRLKRG